MITVELARCHAPGLQAPQVSPDTSPLASSHATANPAPPCLSANAAYRTPLVPSVWSCSPDRTQLELCCPLKPGVPDLHLISASYNIQCNWNQTTNYPSNSFISPITRDQFSYSQTLYSSLPHSSGSSLHLPSCDISLGQSESGASDLYHNFTLSNPSNLSHHKTIKMTRSHKFNDKDHAGLADGTVLPQEHVPKFFAKNGFADADPKKTKKNGGGKGNWGNAGEEAIDEPFNFVNARRRSNSSGLSSHLDNLKTKFEFNEPEPVFEESLHGPESEHGDDELAKTESSSSGGST